MAYCYVAGKTGKWRILFCVALCSAVGGMRGILWEYFEGIRLRERATGNWVLALAVQTIIVLFGRGRCIRVEYLELLKLHVVVLPLLDQLAVVGEVLALIEPPDRTPVHQLR
uniref:Uncharacterized protein n=1 Tax=Anopheles darlingi TaxID=43151 RepID=A0A2M4DCP1_ANODA